LEPVPEKAGKVGPLVCPKCKGAMRVISSIEDPSVIRAILDHLGIWLVRSRLPPKIHDPPIREYAAVDLHLQTHADDFYGDPDYFWDAKYPLTGKNSPLYFNPLKAMSCPIIQ
jgi:hypothetical protein